MSVTRKYFTAIAAGENTAPVKAVYLTTGNSGSKAELFVIGDIAAEDDLSVTYSAADEKGTKTFTVKEYYPEEPKLKRTNENALCVSARTKSAAAAFSSQCAEYTKLYADVSELAAANADNKKFVNFLPQFRLMYACGKDGKILQGSTVYVVTEERDSMLYSDFIADLKADPSRNPERRYLTHQSLLITLSECLKIFYDSNRLKLNLEKAVFGIPKKQRDIPTESLYLLNIDAILPHTYEFVTKSSLLEKAEETASAEENVPAETAAEETPENEIAVHDDDDVVPVSVIVEGTPAENADDGHYEKTVVMDGTPAEPADDDEIVFVPAEDAADEEEKPEEVLITEVLSNDDDKTETPAKNPEAKPEAKAETQAEEKAGETSVTEENAETEAPAEEENAETEVKEEVPAATETAEKPVTEEAKPTGDKPEVKAEEKPETPEVKEETIPETKEEAKPEEKPEEKAETPVEEKHATGETKDNEASGSRPSDKKPEQKHENNHNYNGKGKPDFNHNKENRQNGNRDNRQENKPADKPENKPENKQENKPEAKAETKPEVKADPVSESRTPDVKAYGRIDIPSDKPVTAPVKKETPAKQEAAPEATISSFGRIDIPSQKTDAEKPKPVSAPVKSEKPAPAMTSFGKIEIPSKPAAPVQKTEAKPETKTETKQPEAKAETKPGIKTESKPEAKAENKPEAKADAISESRNSHNNGHKNSHKNGQNNKQNNSAEKPAVNRNNKPADGRKQENKPAEKKQENKPAEKKQENKPADNRKKENKPSDSKKQNSKPEVKAEAKKPENKPEAKAENKPEAKDNQPSDSRPSRPRRRPAKKKTDAPKVADLAFEPGDIFEDILPEITEELVSPEMEKDIKSDIAFMCDLLSAIAPDGDYENSVLLSAGIRTGLTWYRREVKELFASFENGEGPENLEDFTAILSAMREQSVPCEVAAEFAPAAVVPVKKLEKLTSYLDKKRKFPVEVSFRAMLSRHPVYAGTKADAEEVRIMLLGSDPVMFRFLGEMMQNAVSLGKKVAVTVVSDMAEAFGEFLSQCNPAFGELAENSAISSFTFTDIDVSGDSIKETVAVASADAVFVCFNTDEETVNATKAAVSAGTEAAVYAVLDDGADAKGLKKAVVFDIADCSAWDKFITVSANQRENTGKFASVLDSMHTDIMPVPGESCTAERYIWDIADFAAALGITAENGDDLAREFSEKTADEETLGRLIKIRHRKWLMRLVFSGWARMLPQSASYPFSDINTSALTHIALCDCTDSPAKSEKEIRKLYAAKKLTDKLEINYGTYMKIMADRKQSDEENKLFHAAVQKATWLLQSDKPSSLSLVELRSIVSDARNKRAVSDSEFHRSYSNLTEQAKFLSREDYATLLEQLKVLKDCFTGSVGTTTKLTVKQRHALAIRFIPYVLANRSRVSLAVPFGINPGADVFSSLSQFTVASAAKSLVIIYAGSSETLKASAGAFTEAVTGMPAGISTELTLAVVYKEGFVDEDVLAEAVASVRALPSVSAVKTQSVKRDSEVFPAVTGIITAMKITATEKNGSELSMMLTGAGFYEDMPHYTFNSKEKRFTDTVGCSFLQYNYSAQTFSVDDMLVYNQTGEVYSSSRQFFSENAALWNFYRKKPTSWKIFCELADQYNSKTGTVLTLRLTDIFRTRSFAQKNFTYLLPGYACETARKVLDGFYKNGVITSPEYVVHWYTDDTVEVMFRSYEDFTDDLNDFFGNTGRFQSADRIEVYNSRRNVFVKYDSLSVKLIIPDENYRMYVERGTWRELNEILNTLAVNLKFIRELQIKEGMISFRYASHDVKKILISAGSLLENYVYIKCRESGLFDDVRSNIVVGWDRENPDLQNEFDVILTRGYRSLFVECKAKKSLEQDFYYKLSCLTGRFGINAKAVVVADTGETATDIVPDNELKRMRGRALGVETVYTESDIDNIAQVLSDMLDAE